MSKLVLADTGSLSLYTDNVEVRLDTEKFKNVVIEDIYIVGTCIDLVFAVSNSTQSSSGDYANTSMLDIMRYLSPKRSSLILPIGCSFLTTYSRDRDYKFYFHFDSIHKTYINEVTKVLNSLLLPELVGIVKDYGDDDDYVGSIELWVKTRPILLRELKISKNLQHERYIKFSDNILKDQTASYINLNLRHRLSCIEKITFSLINKNTNVPLDILISGTFTVDDSEHSYFTGRSAWKLDKEINNEYVSDKPIYTITMPTEKGICECENAETRCGLTVNIEPQKFEVNWTVMFIVRS